MKPKGRMISLDDLSYQQLTDAAEVWRTSLSGAIRRLILEHAERVAARQMEPQKDEAKEAV